MEQPEREVDLLDLVQILVKWWWLLILIGMVSALAAFIISSHMTPTYQSSVLLVVGGGIESTDPTTGELQTSEKLAATYAKLAQTNSIADTVMKELGLDDKPEISCEVISGTQLLQITASDSDPIRAAAVANAVAEQLLLQGPSNATEESLAYQEFVEDQLAYLEEEIKALNEAVASAIASDDVDGATSLEDRLSEKQNTYSSLLGYVTNSSTNSLKIFEAATPSDQPIKPNIWKNTLFAAIVGIMLTGGGVYVVDYFDDRIKTGEELERNFQLPILGRISESKSSSVVVCNDLLSHQTEEYRMLNMSLKYALPADELTRSFLVTSSRMSEGKSSITANLAYVAALGGQHVIVIDADMRRPKQASIFEISTTLGLSSYLVGEVNALPEVIYSTSTSGLDLLPCGAIPPNPAELLVSSRMNNLLKELEDTYDLVLIDMPPILAVSDVAVVASHVNGTIIIIETGRTQIRAVSQALEILKNAQGKPVGVVMNRVPLKHSRRSGYYYYDDYKAYSQIKH